MKKKPPKSLYEKGEKLVREAQREKDPIIKRFKLKAAERYYGADIKEGLMSKSSEKKAAFVFGIVFIVLLLLIVLFVPSPSPMQYMVFRTVLALAAAGVAAMIPGFLTVQISNWIRAGGALAVFIIVYMVNPAALLT